MIFDPQKTSLTRAGDSINLNFAFQNIPKQYGSIKAPVIVTLKNPSHEFSFPSMYYKKFSCKTEKILLVNI
jgi:hypothetical protein